MKSLYSRIEKYIKKEFEPPKERRVIEKFLNYMKLNDAEDEDWEDEDWEDEEYFDDEEQCAMAPIHTMLVPSPIAENKLSDFIEDELEDSFAKKLNQYMFERDITTAEIYKRCFVDRKLISKITSVDTYHPSKSTVLALCFGLRLNLEESEYFMALAGYAFSKSSKYDLVLKFLLMDQTYDIDVVNEMLYRFEQPCFGE